MVYVLRQECGGAGGPLHQPVGVEEGRQGRCPEMMALEFKRSLRSIITAFLNFIVVFVQKAARCQKFKPEGSR